MDWAEGDETWPDVLSLLDINTADEPYVQRLLSPLSDRPSITLLAADPAELNVEQHRAFDIVYVSWI